jgi:hypothetical protein
MIGLLPGRVDSDPDPPVGVDVANACDEVDAKPMVDVTVVRDASEGVIWASAQYAAYMLVALAMSTVGLPLHQVLTQ